MIAVIAGGAMYYLQVYAFYEDVAPMTEIEMTAYTCLLYTSPSPRDQRGSRMPSSA